MSGMTALHGWTRFQMTFMASCFVFGATLAAALSQPPPSFLMVPAYLASLVALFTGVELATYGADRLP